MSQIKQRNLQLSEDAIAKAKAAKKNFPKEFRSMSQFFEAAADHLDTHLNRKLKKQLAEPGESC